LIVIKLHTKNGYNRRPFQRVIFVILNAVKESEKSFRFFHCVQNDKNKRQN
jgi:hypothetical protein